MKERRVRIDEPGPLATVQDRGRPGWAHLGVSRAGALDAASAALANRLVGNDAGAAVLETTLGGLRLTACKAMTVAVTGAPGDVTVDGRAQPFGEPFSVRGGQAVTVGAPRWGLRSYLALAGGVAVPTVLGSRSTDTLSGLGPPPLVTDTELPVGEPLGRPGGSDVTVVDRPEALPQLRFTEGPRADWFTRSALETLTRSTYTVSTASNRIGLRLDGPLLEREIHQELPSEGIVLGAIQVPASGTPLVFLNDHPTTGGYPVVGVVLPEDLALCAQLRPGDDVRFCVGTAGGGFSS